MIQRQMRHCGEGGSEEDMELRDATRRHVCMPLIAYAMLLLPSIAASQTSQCKPVSAQLEAELETIFTKALASSYYNLTC